MYSDKQNIAILTDLLVRHGVTRSVLCPGSRNSPISHNLFTHPDITCYALTDERSAGFFAIGTILAERTPCAMCVTSGTALLNLAPALAEAYHQHLPLVVISADRAAADIGQQKGQTIEQAGALSRFTNLSVNLLEPHTEADARYCNRLVNEALLALRERGGGPVHINVPISLPLFELTLEELPAQRVINAARFSADAEEIRQQVLEPLAQAQRPMIVIGQMSQNVCELVDMPALRQRYVVLYEALAGDNPPAFDALLEKFDDASSQQPFFPDFVLYMGGTLVSNRIRKFLGRCDASTPFVEVTLDDCPHDTFGHLTLVAHADPAQVLQLLASQNPQKNLSFVGRWNEALERVHSELVAARPAFHKQAETAAVRLLEETLDECDIACVRHYGNSSAIRFANNYCRHYVHCLRGVNGIEGSLSASVGTAAVFSRSIEFPKNVFCVIGDLSFFYDQNALWNSHLSGNLRILLLNNGGGEIFKTLKGLQQSPALHHAIDGSHSTSAEGICRQCGVEYMAAYGSEELHKGITRLIHEPSERPLLLEVKSSHA